MRILTFISVQCWFEKDALQSVKIERRAKKKMVERHCLLFNLPLADKLFQKGQRTNLNNFWISGMF
ncbi:Uncharacterized protein BM_BM17391 [Brugia malayi]|uniref:Uncharacterized protein n=1 Tax=Brugia malayi TaxID=6279 RepID=A0A4E9F6R3_BRUMA|nr:Uncharacterized protein BM_BM17391 [Brugia malayi]VIO91696.1 Uncharacterized protein BM_BM17391 [Brugia malayi]